MTRLYYSVGSINECPINSFGDSLLISRSDPLSIEIHEVLLEPLSRAIAKLHESISNDDDLTFVARFLDLVSIDLFAADDKTRKIRAADAALMSEIAWHFMTHKTGQYAGWNELLLHLSFKFEVAERDHHWPFITNLGGARNWLKKSLKSASDKSWETRSRRVGEGSRSERDRFYDAIAEILIAQSGLEERRQAAAVEGAERGGDDRSNSGQAAALYHGQRDRGLHVATYPPAVGYVTSFDLELEMALLEKRSPFVIVLPFQVRKSDGDTATFVWLYSIVTPAHGDASMEPLLKPDNWALVDQDLDVEKLGMPIVVRLAGAPLLDGPPADSYRNDQKVALGDSIRDRLGLSNYRYDDDLDLGLVGDQIVLESTVLLDENTSLHQWTADLASRRDHGKIYHLGLPDSLLKAMRNTDARFWLLVGVQLADEGVRHRAASIVGASALRDGISREHRSEALKRNGLVVNTRSLPREREIFHWLGLDAVRARYQEIVDSLNHYALHLAAPESRRDPKSVCLLAEAAK
ncbi:hypothetical protein [Gordonia jacobaea]|uniref:hypothetical protein n=1 Tax=Gordonia jacobaea TaxID=122202 RepID=UPI003D71E8BC